MLIAQDSRRLIKKIAYHSIALVCFGDHAYAGGYDDNDFSLRFPVALSRFSSYADVAATGGASAGSKWQSSANPASIAWQSLTGSYRLSLNPQYSAISTDGYMMLENIEDARKALTEKQEQARHDYQTEVEKSE